MNNEQTKPKINLSTEKTPMPQQEPLERNKNFLEVTLGYTEEMALNEAARCLNCKDHPCVNGCPVGVKIPEFISLAAKGDFEAAYNKIKETNAFPAVCGRVCPQERQCEHNCVRQKKGESVGIGRLERYVADRHRALFANEIPDAQKIDSNNNRDKVAVIGSGPAGLACAGELIKNNIDVTVFEALHVPGGVLSYGIPEFRLPKAIVADEINGLKNKGVHFETNTIIGKTITIDELSQRGYKAFFVGSGAGLPSFMGIEGEALTGVYSANEYLTRINLMKAYLEGYDTPIKHHNKVAVVGGGNVAMDAARCAKRMGAENVYIVYRRSIEELPARSEEVHHAGEEGVEFKLLNNPVRIIGDEQGLVTGVECIRMELGEPDASGRRSPKPVEGSEFVLEVDAVIMAIGTTPNMLIGSTTPGLETDRKGCFVVTDATTPAVTTTKEGVFAGGDAVTGSATVILAMGAGKTGAAKIFEYLNK